MTFQVTVTEDAKEVSSGETTATVENSATMTVFGNDYETGTVVNPLEDDDPSDPVKLLRAAYYYEETDNGDGTTTTTVEDRETVDDKGNLIVHPGDILVYYIYYTNNLATTATVTIVDQLDEGVSYVNSSYGGTYDAATHTVTWVRTVPAFDTVEVTLWVQVDDSEEAKNAENTYEIGQNKDESGENTTDYALTYGVDENTTASVSNQASVTVNEVTTYTDVTDNPLGDDDPEAPVKTETSTITSETTDASTGEVTTETKDNSGAVDDKTLVDERTDEQADDTTIIAVDELTSSDTVTYSDVAVGDIVTYNISYYNHFSSTATITIEDELDEGVDFVAVLTGTEKTDTLTAPTETNPAIYELTVENVTDENGDTVTRVTKITWTILAEPLTRGSVSFQAIVNETAMEMEAEETVATVENDADVTITSAETSNTVKQTTNTVENPLEDDDPEDPVKTETTVDGSSDPTITTDGDGVDTYEYDAVGVGETITYTISYYNHHNSTATITIEDVLDDGVDYVEGSASDDGVYDENTRTVTWTLTVAALTRGTVSFQVMVNEDAKTVTSTETVATVDNQATVINSEDTEVGHKYSTNIVTNPIDPDDPSDPQKFVSTSSEAGVNGATVTVGDHITYVITYYNHTNQTTTVIIEDALIDGVTYVSATNDGAYSASKHTVTWTIEDVAPYTGGIVYLTVEVTEDALIAVQVENDAVVTIGNDPYTTNLVVNPVEDEPQDPVKSVDVGDGTNVSSGDNLTYTITYYNHLNTSADVTIPDELDSDVTYVSCSDGGVYNSKTRTVTWTIEDVSAFTEGSVTLTVRVKSSASGSVKNTAFVQIGNNDPVNTNTVKNPISKSSSAKSNSAKSSSPKTGDNFRMTLWVLLLIGSTAGLLVLYFRRKTDKNDE